MKHQVTIIAIGVLAAVAAGAYFARDIIAPGPTAVAGVKGDSKAGAAAAGKTDAKSAAKGGPGAPTPVEVVALKSGVVKEELLAVGSLRSNESVILRPEVSGRIAAIGFRDGQVVRKGQLLIALDATLNEAEVAQARAEYDLALSNLKRSEDLASRKFISSSAQETAASNAQVAEARLKLAQARLSKMRIVAPFDGAVGIRNVSLGDYVKDGTDLVNVEDVRVLKVDFRLPERNFAQIQGRFQWPIARNPRAARQHRRQAAPGHVRARACHRRRATERAAGARGVDRAPGRGVLRLQDSRQRGASRAGEDRRAPGCNGGDRAGPCCRRPGRDRRHAPVA
jgi:multidrug efflux pump subunit AcrA (membrane-fusion protein)